MTSILDGHPISESWVSEGSSFHLEFNKISVYDIYLCFMFNIQLKSKKRDFFSLLPDNKVDINSGIDSEISDFLDNA